MASLPASPIVSAGPATALGPTTAGGEEEPPTRTGSPHREASSGPFPGRRPSGREPFRRRLLHCRHSASAEPRRGAGSRVAGIRRTRVAGKETPMTTEQTKPTMTDEEARGFAEKVGAWAETLEPKEQAVL